jgi:hypothetical protein
MRHKFGKIPVIAKIYPEIIISVQILKNVLC